MTQQPTTPWNATAIARHWAHLCTEVRLMPNGPARRDALAALEHVRLCVRDRTRTDVLTEADGEVPAWAAGAIEVFNGK